MINIEMKGPFFALLGGSVGTPKIEGNGVRTPFWGGAKTELRYKSRGPKAVKCGGVSLCYYVSAKVQESVRKGVFVGWRPYRSKNIKTLPRLPPCSGGTSCREVPSVHSFPPHEGRICTTITCKEQKHHARRAMPLPVS